MQLVNIQWGKTQLEIRSWEGGKRSAPPLKIRHRSSVNCDSSKHLLQLERGCAALAPFPTANYLSLNQHRLSGCTFNKS
jgi:hypothetical protein